MRPKRPCPPETNLLRFLLGLYINFQRKEQSDSRRRQWLTTSLTDPSRTKSLAAILLEGFTNLYWSLVNKRSVCAAALSWPLSVCAAVHVQATEHCMIQDQIVSRIVGGSWMYLTSIGALWGVNLGNHWVKEYGGFLARIQFKRVVPGRHIDLQILQSVLWCRLARRGVTRGERGNNSPGAESLRGRRKVTTMSHVLSPKQYICFRKTSGSNMGVPNVLPSPGAI